ncbi:MAG: outer membrane beta-barrel protein [Gelidibacter sp.]
MKTVLVFATLATFVMGQVMAQGEDKLTVGGWNKGDISLSAKFAYNSTKEGDNKENSFKVMPCLGVFVTDDIEIGGQLGYMSTKYEVDGDEVDKYSTFSVGAYGNYYFSPKLQFTPFAGVNFDYMSTNYDTDDYKVTGFEGSLSVGFNYWLSDCFVLQASLGALGYSTTKPDFDGADSRNEFFTAFNTKRVRFGAAFRF